MHILYLEDNPLDADLVMAELSRSTASITTELVTTHAQAVARLSLCTPEQPTYDLVLTDLRLPDGNGLSLVPLIHEHRLNMAVVVLLGAGRDDMVISVLKAGASDYVVKQPGYATRLPAALTAALLRHQAEAARQIRTLNVFYVDHRVTDIKLTRQHFARFAPHVHLEAANLLGNEVLAKLPQSGECDVLLLDYHLPVTNGLDLLKGLQQTPQRDLPVVLLAEPGHEEIGLQALHLGAMDYIVKHAGYLHKLPMVVEHVFERARLVREQTALKASEAYFRSVVENAADVITVMNADGVVHYQSPSSEAVLGYRPDELVSTDGFRLMHPKDAITARQAFETALLNPGMASPIGEVRLQHKDGSWRVLDGTGKCHVVNEADWKLVVVNWHDVTARKQAEEVLGTTKTYVENLIESASAMVIGLDADGAIQIFNEAASAITGYRREDLSGQPWLEVLMPKDRYPEAWAEYPALGSAWPRSLECPVLTKAGEECYIAWQTNEIREQGQLVQTVLFGMDVTERKRAEAKLADQEKRFRALVERSEDAIALVSVEGDLLYQSPAAGRILGLRGEAWLGRKILDLIHPDDLPAYQTLLGQLAEKPAGGAHGQFRFRHQDGAWRWIELAASDWPADSNAQAIVVNYRDVTEAVMRERELEAMVSVSRALRIAQNRKELAMVILDQVRALLGAEAAALVLRDPMTGELILDCGCGLAKAEAGQALLGGRQIFDAVLASGQPYVANDRAVGGAVAQVELFDAHLTTVAGIPLAAQKQPPLGTLWLGRQAPMGEAEMRLFTAIGSLAANALHRATRHEETAEYARQMALATQVGHALAETFDLSRIYPCLGQAVRDLFPDICGVFVSLFDGARNLTSCAYAFSDGEVIPSSEFPPVSLGLSGKGPLSEAMMSRRPVITDRSRSRNQSGTGGLSSLRIAKPPAQAGLYVPMLTQGQAIGVIQVQSCTPNRFSQTEAEVLLLLGSTAAAAIENARLFQTTRRQRDELSIVSQVVLVAGEPEPFDGAVARATEALKLVWPKTSSLGFMFVDEAGSQLRLHASYLGASAGTPPIPLGQGLVGWVAREQKPVRAGNVLADRRYVPITLSTRSQMAAPLVAGGRVVGVINVESPQLDTFSGDDLLLLTTLAEKLSLLFEKSRQESRLAANVEVLQQQVKDYVAQLEAAKADLQQAKRETEQAEQMRKEFLGRLNRVLHAAQSPGGPGPAPGKS